MIQWTCASCGKSVSVASPLAATEEKCPHCAQSLVGTTGGWPASEGVTENSAEVVQPLGSWIPWVGKQLGRIAGAATGGLVLLVIHLFGGSDGAMLISFLARGFVLAVIGLALIWLRLWIYMGDDVTGYEKKVMLIFYLICLFVWGAFSAIHRLTVTPLLLAVGCACGAIAGAVVGGHVGVTAGETCELLCLWILGPRGPARRDDRLGAP
jgi:hypothetical protein